MQFSIITITSFVTLLNDIVIYIAKTSFDKDVKKYIPITSIIFGMILGAFGYCIPDMDTGSNLVESLFLGISAGASAVGINQVGKQLDKPNVEINEGHTSGHI